ncbi:prepilin-type N-terminal cleavage/methylation domain-containing protein [Opitutaceae bacterium TAV1]|nr:prepilin-type N-terminal cleavage/methylation domain-containing protein [Opitutaceae bacterium TAV1]
MICYLKVTTPIFNMKKCPHHKAFTLVELLTVIVIIGVLAGILIPVVGKARRSARTAVCASNLRQIAIGYLSYIQDPSNKSGALPVFRNGDPRIFYTWDGTATGLAMVIESGHLPPVRTKFSTEYKDRLIYACPDLQPISAYIGGGDQITYWGDIRNGNIYKDSALGAYVTVDGKRYSDFSAPARRTQVICASPTAAHEGRPRAMFLDGHVAALTSEQAKNGWNGSYWNFDKFETGISQ